MGDLLGSPTCFRPNGLSSVDYGLATPSLYSQIQTFSVQPPLLTISDHTPISLTLATNFINNLDESNCPTIPKPTKIIWDKLA